MLNRLVGSVGALQDDGGQSTGGRIDQGRAIKGQL
jgi:hypothetical protein